MAHDTKASTPNEGVYEKSNDLQLSHAGSPNDLDKVEYAEIEEVQAKFTRKTLLLMVTICSGGFLFGYDIGVISSLLVLKDFVLRFGGAEVRPGVYELETQTQSLITALLSAGTFFGSMAQAPISDWIGRKRAMLLWATVFTIGAVIQTATIDAVEQLIVGRFIAGLAVGALSGLCPLYLGETAPKALRGTLVSGYQLLIIFGIFMSYGIDWACASAQEHSYSWRIPIALQMLWGVMLFVMVLFLPESPRWYLQKNRAEEARIVMADVRDLQLTQTAAGPRGDAAMEKELYEMNEIIQQEAHHFAGTNFFSAYLKCFSLDKQLWRRTAQGMLLQILQQLNGQNYYYYYGPTFFQAADLTLSPLQIQFIFGAVSLICTFPALWTVENFGRRNSLLVGSAVCATCAYIVAFVGKYGLAPDNVEPNSSQKAAGNAFVAFAVMHLAVYSCFWGPVPWVYLSESFPQHVRAKCISLGSSANWVFNFLLSWFSPPIAQQYKSFIMLIFGSVMWFALGFVYFVLPEVKGLTLEEVDQYYASGGANRPWRKYKRAADGTVIA
ncbi:unnamed protein product [Sympodiomycopsis kandeliae]